MIAKITYRPDLGDKVELTTIPCPYCEKVSTVIVKEEDWRKWLDGKNFIQDAFPDLPPEQRELFLTGICGECYAKMSEDLDEDEKEGA